MLPTKRPPTHPGEMLLKEFIEPMGITQKDLCEHLRWTYARLNEIINGRRGITADSALSLAEAFKMEPEFWLNLQRDWDLWHSKKRHVRAKPFRLKIKFA
jgi:addiction module HigA family antidote